MLVRNRLGLMRISLWRMKSLHSRASSGNSPSAIRSILPWSAGEMQYQTCIQKQHGNCTSPWYVPAQAHGALVVKGGDLAAMRFILPLSLLELTCQTGAKAEASASLLRGKEKHCDAGKEEYLCSGVLCHRGLTSVWSFNCPEPCFPQLVTGRNPFPLMARRSKEAKHWFF